MLTEEQIRIAEQSLARQLDWIKSVDTKVSILVAVNVATLGLLATRIPAKPEDWCVTALFVCIGAGCYLLSLVFCWMASFPRLESPNLSMLFFGSISSRSPEDYASRFASLSEEAYLADLLTQVHRNAELASVKFGKVRWATGLLLVGTLPWLWCLYVIGSVQ